MADDSHGTHGDLVHCCIVNGRTDLCIVDRMFACLVANQRGVAAINRKAETDMIT